MQDYGGPNQELPKLIPTWKLPFTFITLTSALSDWILAHNPEAPVFVVRNAVDMSRFASAPRQMPEVPTFGFVWRNHPSKGIDVAIDALARAQQRRPPLGRGLRPRRGGAVRPLAGKGAEFIPRPPDEALPAIYGRCTAWLFPSRMEGFGLPITEAMACRTPVIGTRAGAGPDLIEDGRNGFLVDVEDADAMARAIDAMAGMPAPQWQAMSEAAYATVAGYGWSDAAARFEAALLHAARRRRRSARRGSPDGRAPAAYRPRQDRLDLAAGGVPAERGAVRRGRDPLSPVPPPTSTRTNGCRPETPLACSTIRRGRRRGWRG